MTREEKSNLLNELLEYEEKNDIGLLTRAERREFQQWVSEALEQEPKMGRLTNSEWIDFLSEQFDISRTSAKEMLHVMMSVKKNDNFKKQFSGRK